MNCNYFLLLIVIFSNFESQILLDACFTGFIIILILDEIWFLLSYKTFLMMNDHHEKAKLDPQKDKSIHTSIYCCYLVSNLINVF